MGYLITCRDADDSAPLRDLHLPAHRHYVDTHAECLLLSGPLTDDGGDRRVGQVFVIEAPDRASAVAFVEGDPFTRAGVFSHIRIDRLEMRFEHGRRVAADSGVASE